MKTKIISEPTAGFHQKELGAFVAKHLKSQVSPVSPQFFIKHLPVKKAASIL